MLRPIDSFSNSKRRTDENYYYKLCKWSPDDSCLLTSDSNNEALIFNLPPSLICSNEHWKPVLSILEGDLIYDIEWFPLMRSDDPISCCFVVSSKDHPIHMWDAYSGKLRCSYKSHNNQNELVAPISVLFSPDGYNLICGVKNEIKIFDVNQPSSQPIAILDLKQKTFSSPGIVSALDFIETSNSSSLYAAGTYNNQIWMLDLRYHDLIGTIELQNHITSVESLKGVTQICHKENQLFIGCRKSNNIFVFDIRNSNTYVRKFPRCCDSYQKIQFSSTGDILMSGDSYGYMTMFDIKNTDSSFVDSILYKEKFQDQSIPACSYNKTLKLVALGSGSRIFDKKNYISCDLKVFMLSS